MSYYFDIFMIRTKTNIDKKHHSTQLNLKLMETPRKPVAFGAAVVKSPPPHLHLLIDPSLPGIKKTLLAVLLDFYLHVDPAMAWSWEFLKSGSSTFSSAPKIYDFGPEALNAFSNDLEMLLNEGELINESSYGAQMKANDGKSIDASSSDLKTKKYVRKFSENLQTHLNKRNTHANIESITDAIKRSLVMVNWTTTQPLPFQSPLRKVDLNLKLPKKRNYIFILAHAPETHAQLLQWANYNSIQMDFKDTFELLAKDFINKALWEDLASNRICLSWLNVPNKTNEVNGGKMAPNGEIESIIGENATISDDCKTKEAISV